MRLWPRSRSVQQRASYDRSAGDMLVNEPQIMWMGYDSGGGRYPIGPHGPFSVECLPAISRLTGIITGPLTSSPWTVAESTLGLPLANAPQPPPRWMLDPQLVKPDSRYPMPILPAAKRLPRSTFWSTWLRSAVWFGTGYLMFVEAADGSPLPGTLQVLNPRCVTPKRTNGGELVWEVRDPNSDDPADMVRTDREGYLRLDGPPTRIIALRDPHAPIDGDGRAEGMFERHKETFGLARTIENYSTGTFRSGVPAGYLRVTDPKVNLDADLAGELRRRWMEMHGGDRRSIAVLNATTDFNALQFTPVEAAMIAAKRANLADIALAFSLDPTGALGVDMGSSMTYANVGQHFQRLQQDLLPWITAVEQTIGMLLAPGMDMRIDFSDLTRPDPTQQIAMLNTAISSGLLTVNEGRAQIGLPARSDLPAPTEGDTK